MQTTIDAGGRIVVPKSLRDAMGLVPGRRVDIVFTDGRLEIELAPTEVRVENVKRGRLPRIVTDEQLPELTSEAVRDTLESTRR